MKKLILGMVFVLATATTFINANTSNEEVAISITESTEVEEYFGCASDCVSWARNQVFTIAYDNGEHPNDYQFYMDIYMRYYTGCYRGC